MIYLFFSLSTIAWAGDRSQTIHAEGSIEFKAFAVPSAEISEESTQHRKLPPVHLSAAAAPESGRLWNFIADNSIHVDPNSDRSASEYAAVGPDAYLAIMSTGYIYLAEPKRGVLRYLTRVPRADQLDPLSFRSLPNGWAWALVHASDLRHGRFSEGFGALFADLSGKTQPSVMYFDLGGFSADNDGEGPERLCGDSSEAQDPLGDTPLARGQQAESFSVQDVNHNGLDDVVIDVAEQDCKTRERRKLRYVFVNTGHGFAAAKISDISR